MALDYMTMSSCTETPESMAMVITASSSTMMVITTMLIFSSSGEAPPSGMMASRLSALQQDKTSGLLM